MKIISSEQQDKYFVLTIETDPSLFDKFFSHFFWRAQNQLKIKGFRRGKVPVDVAQKHMNIQHIHECAFKEMIHETIENLKKSKELLNYEIFDEVVKNEIIDFKQQEKIVVFKSFFEAKPDIELGDYLKIETIFEPKDEKNIYWMQPQEADPSDKDVLCVKIHALNKENYTVDKYSFSYLEIDLENTKLPKKFIEEIKKAKISKPVNFKFQFSKNEDECEFSVELIACFSKQPITEKLVEEISKNNKDIKNLDDLKEMQKNNFLRHNDEMLKSIVIRWTNGNQNKLSSIPEHNLSVETRKILNNHLKQQKQKVKHNQEFLQKVFQNIFYDNLAKVKIACVLEKISKNEKMDATEEEIESFKKRFFSMASEQELSTLKKQFEEYPEFAKSLTIQEKCIDFLKKKIIFSN